MPEHDYYEILRITRDADGDAVRAAYRALCKRYHPDTGRPGASARTMQLVNAAYAVLSDAQRRKAYDALRPGSPARRARAATRRAGDATLDLGQGLRMPLARVPAGEFLMGSCVPGDGPATGEGCSCERRALWLGEYLIGMYPVTVAEYAAFVAATGRRSTPWARRAYSFDPASLDEPDRIVHLDRNWQHPFGGASSVVAKGEHPVLVVTWFDAVAFCDWAGEVTGAMVRLPTAAEWQKAARGVDGRCYPWGNGQPGAGRCNYRAGDAGRARGGDTTPVGSFSPRGDSPFGCADMLGNVWEWTSTRTRDRQGNLLFGDPYRSDDGREEREGRDFRLLMGGSFESPYDAFCCGSGRDQEPWRARDTGFRVCVAPRPTP